MLAPARLRVPALHDNMHSRLVMADEPCKLQEKKDNMLTTKALRRSLLYL